MNGYLIEIYKNMGNAYTCRRFLEEGKRAGISLTMIGAADVIQTRGKNGELALFQDGECLKPVDVILHRFKAGALKDRIDELGHRSFNSLRALNRYNSKANEMNDLYGYLPQESMKMPSFLLAATGTDYEQIISITGTPFVAKGLYGSCGREVFLIRSKPEYKEVCRKYKNLIPEMIFEEYIETSAGRDLRCLVLHGEALACMERSAADGFHANVARGGTVKEYPVNDRIRELAAKIYQCTELDYFGLDLLFGKEDYLFCEINVTPGMEGIERASGKNLAGEVIDYILQTVR